MLHALVFIGALFALLGSDGVAEAHPMPDSMVSVRVHEARWRLHLEVPFDRLAMALIATGRMPDPGPGFDQYPVPSHAMIAGYLGDTVHLTAPDGRPWRLVVKSMTPPPFGQRNWTIDVDAVPPVGASRRSARLDYDLVIRDVIPDVAIVAIDQDWQGGVLPGHPRLLGSLSQDHRSLTVSPEAGDGLGALGQMVAMGAWHILEGADHIAFLLTLLLSVTLVAQGRRWAPQWRNRTVISNTLWRVSAFTAGHTVSLLATSLGWLPAAGQGIEVLIAVSVAVSAAHALVPLYPRREAWIAVFFGLVHGMAFATAIRELDLTTTQTVLATLGFNVGIELVQLGIVALVLPLLFLLRGRRFEPLVRRTVGVAALLAAIWWAADRMTG
ncbi:HupE/UreJ family protein [Novosphingobium sp. 1949]|uniref:HupE/UreJ family protein n=1 Tax=Novosphingobium organovorum TaxID=2930092 RepID=A0ABT0BFV1_9SPHN|nr:HupE/UreJ family protein [Novosphingobium organovorum]MCJ2183937.1 HupE/UreJ family protein [Novosphingobium organovorum]